jgi:hypothetical protein
MSIIPTITTIKSKDLKVGDELVTSIFVGGEILTRIVEEVVIGEFGLPWIKTERDAHSTQFTSERAQIVVR